ncbi:MAG: PHB depolymerase family esterase [Bacteroidota bacterium]
MKILSLPYNALILFFGVLILLESCAAQSKLVSGTIETSVSQELQYYLYFPPAYEIAPYKKSGLLLFLHGGGESGASLGEIKKNGPPKLLAEGKDFPFMVLAPQNPHKKRWWNVHAVIQLLDTIIARHNVDKTRIYLTGLSRGGSAAWDLAVQYPDKFAALAVVCGMAPVPYAHWLNKNVPIWVFHGDEDAVISVEESDKMVEKLKEMNYNVRYTRYQGVGHNSWERAYTTEALYEWLAEQQRYY